MKEFGEYCKPCCEIYSINPLVDLPEECCCSGEIFLRREALKQKIRKYKEEIIHYEALISSGYKDKNSYIKAIKNLQKFIEKYSVVGSDNW